MNVFYRWQTDNGKFTDLAKGMLLQLLLQLLVLMILIRCRELITMTTMNLWKMH